MPCVVGLRCAGCTRGLPLAAACALACSVYAPVCLDVTLSQRGSAFEATYEMLDMIGKGTYATVYRCRHRLSGDMFAVKVFNTRDFTPKQMATLRKEAAIMTRVGTRLGMDDHTHTLAIAQWFGDCVCVWCLGWAS